MGSPSCLNSKESACRCRRRGFDLWAANIPLEEELATHSSIPAWEIPWTVEPGQATVHGGHEESGHNRTCRLHVGPFS